MLIKNIHTLGYTDNKAIQHIYIDEKGNLHILKNEETIPSSRCFDAQGEFFLMPGWLDSHIHGFGGYDFSDACEETLPLITKALGDTGLSYCMATLISLDLPQLKKSLAAINRYLIQQNKKPSPGHCQIIGIHLEGPFIAKNCKGAHNEQVFQEKITIEIFKDIIKSAPAISQWKITLSPDIEGAIEFISHTRALVIEGRKKSIKVFIGHTNAHEKYINDAVHAGAIGFTHLGNANQEHAHRCTAIHENDLKSNVVRWVVNHAKTNAFFVELIVDGEHLSREFVKFIKEKIGDRIIQVTDALGPSGLKDGEYELGGLCLLKQGKKFVLKNHPEKLAGSAATFASVVEKYAEWIAEPNIDRIHSIYAASVLNPRMGSIDPSFKLRDENNFVVTNKHGKLVMSVCSGKMILHEPIFSKEFCKVNY